VRAAIICSFVWSILVFGSSAAGQQPNEIPFQLVDDWAVVVRGTVGGIPGREILIDTGAVPSLVSNSMAKKMGLDGGEGQVSAMNRRIDIKRVQVPEVQIGPVTAGALNMVAADLTQIEHSLHVRIDAVIGLDLLAKENFTIDYRHKRLRFGVEPRGKSLVPFEIKHAFGGAYLLVSMETEGERLQMLFDTGTNGITLLRPRTSQLRREAPSRSAS
jgi:hypothetical protein